MQKDNLTKRITKAVDAMYSILINRGAIDRLAKALENVENGTKSKKNITFVRITEEMLEEINIIRELQGQKTLTKRNVTAFSNTINKHLGKHIREYGSARNVAQMAFYILTSSDVMIVPGDDGSKNTILATERSESRVNSVVLGDSVDGKTSIKSVSPRTKNQIQRLGSKIAARREGQDPHRRLGKT